MAKQKETKEEKKARELRDMFGSIYENYNEEDIKTKIVELLDEIDITEEQRKAQSDAMKDLIDQKKDELMYCRQRRQFLLSAEYRASLEEAADELLNE